MSTLLDPGAMTPPECRAEIVSLLAAAFLRIRADRRRSTAHLPENAPVMPSLSDSRNRVDNASGESVHVPR